MGNIILVPHRTRPFSDLDAAPEQPGDSKGSWGCLAGVIGATAAVLIGYHFGVNRTTFRDPEPATVAIKSLLAQSRELSEKAKRQQAEIAELRRELDARKRRL